MLLGHWQEMCAPSAKPPAPALAELLPDSAEHIHGDHVETVAIADLRLGDVLLVRPGGRVPADGAIVDGSADLDTTPVRT
ncbi:MAG: hypothetical protein ACKVWR_15155 [Acidimicrobiales bacterium]